MIQQANLKDKSRLLQLVSQIVEALENNEEHSVSFLLQDQSQQAINFVLHRINQPNLQEKFREILNQSKQNKQVNKNKQKQDDNIRKINKQFYDSDSSQSEDVLLESYSKGKKRNKKQEKHQPIKLQEKFGFKFYGNVKCLMIAYGDLSPLESSIKMMHSQLQLLFKKIMEPVRGEQDKIQKNCILITSSFQFKVFLKPIFAQQFKDFQQIYKIYKKIKKNTRKKINRSQSVSSLSDSSSKKQSDDDFPSSDQNRKEGIKKQGLHMRTKNTQQMQYLVDITQGMNQNQYHRYCQCRSVNLLLNKKSPEMQKKLIQFVDHEQMLKRQVFSLDILQILSFISCRFIRKIIYKIIRQKNKDLKDSCKLKKIQKSIQSQQITSTGNMLIDQYAEKIQQTVKEIIQLGVKAKEVFIDQFSNQKLIRQIFPRAVLSKYKGDSQKMWNQCPHYRKMWEQRLKGQKQILKIFKNIGNSESAKQQILDKIAFGDIVLQSQYSKIIVQNHQLYFSGENNQQESKINQMKVFRKYLTSQRNQVIQQEIMKRKIASQKKHHKKTQSYENQENIKGKKPRKRTKLQSLSK